MELLDIRKLSDAEKKTVLSRVLRRCPMMARTSPLVADRRPRPAAGK